MTVKGYEVNSRIIFWNTYLMFFFLPPLLTAQVDYMAPWKFLYWIWKVLYVERVLNVKSFTTLVRFMILFETTTSLPRP